MLVTLDSNVARIVPRIASRCNAQTVRWCVSDCECSVAPKDEANRTKLLYDTPIALCESWDMPSDIRMHFIYIDFDERNPSFDRIMRNIGTLKSRYVVIGNDEKMINGLSYALRIKNVPMSIVADAVASIINGYVESGGTLQHPNDIITKNYGSTAIANVMIYDIFAQRRRSSEYQIDCERCD